MKYFITGATGFIGGHVARKLVAQGHEVVALVRKPDKARDLAELGITLAQGDITDKESMREPMTGVDGVYHIAAWYKVGEKSDLAERINVEGTRNVLELMRELNIAKGVYTSTVGVFSDTKGEMVTEDYYFDPQQEPFISAYERTKWQAHYEVALPMMQAGLPLVIVQPGLVYGPGDTSAFRENLLQYLTGKMPMMPQKTAFVWAHVEDIADAHILAMDEGTPGESYVIAGEHKTLIDALRIAEEISGVPTPKLTVPPFALKGMAGLMGVVNAVVPLQGQYHPETLRTIAGVTYIADNSKAKRELGYDPRPLREGLHETLIHEMKLLGMDMEGKRI